MDIDTLYKIINNTCFLLNIIAILITIAYLIRNRNSGLILGYLSVSRLI